MCSNPSHQTSSNPSQEERYMSLYHIYILPLTPLLSCHSSFLSTQAQQQFGLKPALPDFYNILLERPRHDPGGYGLLYVDASQRANVGSSCSHSCNSNCTSAVVARNGKLCIALTTNRHIAFGEELSMDYGAITTSDVEWRAAICLCGMSSCRGSFLHYATQDDLQQVLNQNWWVKSPPHHTHSLNHHKPFPALCHTLSLSLSHTPSHTPYHPTPSHTPSRSS